MPGQLDGVHRHPAAPQRPGHRLEVHRVPARVREADQRAGRDTVGFRETLQQPRARLADRSRGPGPAVDQRGQVGQHRVPGDVLERDRLPQRDRQLHGRQRRPTAVEEVVEPADLVVGDPEHGGVGGRQPPLGRGARRVSWLVDDLQLGGERRQRLRVDLAVRGERQLVPPVERHGHHVVRQRPAQPLPQHVDLDLPHARVEGHQVLAAVGPLGHHHRRVVDPRHPQQRVVDLPDLDPEPGDLDLRVAAAEELQLALGRPPPVVAALVQPRPRPVGVGQVDRPGPLRVVDVPAAHADAGEADQARGTQRHRDEVLVDHVHGHVLHRGPQRDPVALGGPVHHLVVRVVRGLGQPVGVDEREPRAGARRTAARAPSSTPHRWPTRTAGPAGHADAAPGTTAPPPGTTARPASRSPGRRRPCRRTARRRGSRPARRAASGHPPTAPTPAATARCRSTGARSGRPPPPRPPPGRGSWPGGG